MRRIGEKIRQSLELGSEAFREEYKDDPIRFLTEKCGRKYPRKIRRFFEDVYFGRVNRAAVKANRGGGKSTVFADLAACLYALRDFDGFIVGGAETQAKNAYNYAAQDLQIDDRLDDFNAEVLKTLCRSNRGNWLKFSAASTKQVRGPHCGDPHRQMDNDMQPHGGITIIDEECETEQDIVTAVKYTVNTAQPGILIRGSTLHKVTGSFADLCEDPGAVGVTLYEWDCFDTAEKCKRQCKKCRYEFAGRKRPGFTKWRKQHPEWQHGKGYCEGRAKAGGGWRTINNIEQSFLGASNLEEFEVEEMGWRAAAGGQVLDPVLLDLCLTKDVPFLPGQPSQFLIDWGMKGWTCIHVAQKQNVNDIAITQTEYFHNTSIEVIKQRLKILRDMLHVWRVSADASHPFENKSLEIMGFKVNEVNFGQYKDLGVGWIRGLVEQRRLKIRGEKKGARYNFPDAQTERFFRELKGWRKDKNGKIVKKDDHGPDTLLCGVVEWGEQAPWVMEYMSSGRRKSMEMVGAR